TRQLGRAVLERCLLGLAPGGGCQPRRSPVALVRSYRTVSPLPERLTPPGRSALCCPVREVTPAWLTPAPCPAESGLSSSDPKTARGRPAGSSAGEDTRRGSGAGGALDEWVRSATSGEPRVDAFV